MDNSQVKAEAPRGAELTERLMAFAVRLVKLVDSLPNGITGRHIAVQLFRSGTSAGANYEEARGAESKADFTHKLGIALKEIKESRFRLELVHRAEILRPNRVKPLLDECSELCAIIGKSVMTAKKRRKQWLRFRQWLSAGGGRPTRTR